MRHKKVKFRRSWAREVKGRGSSYEHLTSTNDPIQQLHHDVCGAGSAGRSVPLLALEGKKDQDVGGWECWSNVPGLWKRELLFWKSSLGGSLGTAHSQYQATETPSTTCICPLRVVGYECFIKAELMTRGGKAVCSNGPYYFIPHL